MPLFIELKHDSDVGLLTVVDGHPVGVVQRTTTKRMTVSVCWSFEREDVVDDVLRGPFGVKNDDGRVAH